MSNESMTHAPDFDGPIDSETPVNPYSLLEAVNRSSDTAHMGWLLFLAIMAYLMIAVAGVTHRDLLLATPVQLPVLGVEIQQVQFFQFAPLLLVMFHLGLVSQLVLLARKTLEFDYAVHKLEPTRRRSHPLRLELHNFFFVQGIAGPNRSLVMAFFLHGMSWLTLVVIPVVLILFIQISFLPYHSIPITWTHRIALLFDIGVLSLLGVFLSRAETHFFQALRRALWTHPITAFSTTLLIAAVMFASFVIATIPGEALDRVLRRPLEHSASETWTTAQSDASTGGWLSFLPSNPIPFLFGSPDGTFFGLFHRNLIVTDSDLVVDRDVSEGEPSISLRNRDLRFARLDRSDLHQADMTGANLDGASLSATNLNGVRLNCSNEDLLILTDDRKAAKCASARHANFTGARLVKASMNGIDLRYADLKEANLEGIALKYAWLTGTNFSYANLQKADITGGARAQGAVFLIASLEGADLTGAQLQYADFSSAAMQAITLEHAQMQGANLRDANLDSAFLRRTRLSGADMTGSNLAGADLSEATVWLTMPPMSTNVGLADLATLNLAPPDARERETLEAVIKSVTNRQLQQNLRDSLAGLLDDSQSRRWGETTKAEAWQTFKQTEQPGVITNYRAELTAHLVRLACQSRWANGAVADGIARRALNPNFDADLSVIHASLDRGRTTNGKECTGGLNMNPNLMSRLDTAAEAETQTAAAATR